MHIDIIQYFCYYISMKFFDNIKFNNQVKYAAGLLENFHINMFHRKNGEIIERVIDEHNLEYCFFPEVWNVLHDFQKMAVMVKFSEKYSPDLPLGLGGFINDEEIDPDGSFVMIDPESKRVLVDFKTVLSLNASRVLIELLSYKDLIKESFFLNSMSNLSFAQYANFHQLRYLLVGHENMILLAANPNLKNEDITQDMLKVCDFQNPNTQFILRSTLKAIKLYEKANFFTRDFNDFIEIFKQEFEDTIKPFKAATEKYLGDKNKTAEAIILAIYNLYGLKEKNIEYETFKNRILSLPKPDLDEELFPNIVLPVTKKYKFEK